MNQRSSQPYLGRMLMGMRTKHSGLTLVELLFTLGILAILLTLCALLFVSSWNKFHSTTSLQDVQSNAIVGIDRFAADFRETRPLFVVTKPAGMPRYAYFPSPRNRSGVYLIAPSGEPQWTTWIFYYLSGDPNNPGLYYLARKQVDGDLDNPPPISLADDLDKAQIVSRNVEDFSLNRLALPGNRYSYNARLLTRSAFRGKLSTFRAERDFTFTELIK